MSADDFASVKPGKLVEVELDADSIAVSNADVESAAFVMRLFDAASGAAI